MNELLREIEEDIRREKFDRLWRRFGRIMVGVSVVVVLATIVIVVLQNQKQTAAMEKTAQFIRGLDRINIEDFKGAVAVFDELSNDPASPYYSLAMLQKAEAQLALGDKDSAAATYRALAQQDTVFAGLAAILASPEDGQPVDPDPRSPFYYSQREWGGWQAVRQGRRDEAVAVFLALRNDQDAPFSMRERMNEALLHIAPQALNPSAADSAATKGKP